MFGTGIYTRNVTELYRYVFDLKDHDLDQSLSTLRHFLQSEWITTFVASVASSRHYVHSCTRSHAHTFCESICRSQDNIFLALAVPLPCRSVICQSSKLVFEVGPIVLSCTNYEATGWFIVYREELVHKHRTSETSLEPC